MLQNLCSLNKLKKRNEVCEIIRALDKTHQFDINCTETQRKRVQNTAMSYKIGLKAGWALDLVEVDPNAWPGDFYAWLPVAAEGKPVLEPQDVTDCPADLDLAALAPLSPFDRLRCAGSRVLTMDAGCGPSTDLPVLSSALAVL